MVSFLDADMYSMNHTWRFSHTQRDMMRRVAVISSAHLRDTFWESFGVNESIVNGHLQTRLKRFLLKDIAILYWHVPLNKDPNSLFQSSIEPDLSTDDIYLSDLYPERSPWGRLEGEPCIYFGYSSKDGITPLPGKLIRSCDEVGESPQQDESTEIFELDLRMGLLIDKHTDFYLPGSIPIEFRRATRDGWKRPMGFGLSGTHNYDKFLNRPTCAGSKWLRRTAEGTNWIACLPGCPCCHSSSTLMRALTAPASLSNCAGTLARLNIST